MNTTRKTPPNKPTASAKKVAPKAKPAVPQKKVPAAKKRVALAVEALLEVSVLAATDHVWGWDTAEPIEAAARRCVELGRADIAATLANALREDLRAPALLEAARGGEGSLDEAIDALLEACTDATKRDAMAAKALRASDALKGITPRTAELAAVADAVVEEAFAKDPAVAPIRFGHFVSILDAHLDAGRDDVVIRVVRRWLEADPRSLGEVLVSWNIFWLVPNDPKWTVALANALPDNSRSLFPRSVEADPRLASCAGWPLADLETLLALVPWLGPPLGKLLVANGRTADAKKLLFPEGAPGPAFHEVVDLAERHLVFGDKEGAKKVLLAHPTNRAVILAEELRLDLGIETLAEAMDRAWKDHDRVRILARLAKLAFARGAKEEIAKAVAMIDKALKAKPDEYGEAEAEDLRAFLAEAEGPAAVRALLEVHVVKRFLAGKEATALAYRAIRYGAPEVALKAARLQRAPDKRENANDVAEAFLPTDPASALAALQALGGKEMLAEKLRRQMRQAAARGQRRYFLAELWAAALAPLDGENAA